MKKVKVVYNDKVGCAVGIYETRPYWPDEAVRVKEGLEFMGCFNLKIVPADELVKEAA